MGNSATENYVPHVEWDDRTVSVDVVCDILADRHRRAAVSYLCERESPVMVDDLIDEVLNTLDSTPADVDDLRNRLHIQFHHVHLPKLSDVGVIEYQDVPNVVDPQPVLDEYRPFVDWADHVES